MRSRRIIEEVEELKEEKEELEELVEEWKLLIVSMANNIPAE